MGDKKYYTTTWGRKRPIPTKGDQVEFQENHRGSEGTELEQENEERVQRQAEDPEVLANPTELRSGGISGGDTGTTQGGDPGPIDGASIPGNAGDATGPGRGNVDT